ncbi:ribosomal RNA-processing protein 12 [Euphorbia lathyris]|uniref:ribosomal RNA-processing protein 12 n=1 Tax=Euphorbia lathyris TaxID=212925 RepID=UPI0033138A02
MKPNLEAEEPQIPLKDDSDICQQLLSRYSASKAPHHQHLLATAAAIRSILSADSLNLSPSTYFSAAINNLSNYESLDSTAIAALLSFVSIVVPLIPEKGIHGDKASEAVGVLVAVLERHDLGVAGVTCVVKCLGVLIVGFCDLEDWGSVKKGFQIVLKLSVDKRPKVRRIAQDCLENVFKSFRSSSVIKKSSKLVLSLLRHYEHVALELSELKIVDGSKDETLSKPEHVEVLHMLNLLKLIVPYLSVKTSSNVLSDILKYIPPHFSALTRHILRDVEAFLENSSNEVIGPHIEDIIKSLSSYVSVRKKNPADTLIHATTLLKVGLHKLRSTGSRSWMRTVPKICGTVAGLLTCETTTASQAADIMKEIINYCIDGKKILTDESLIFEDGSQESEEAGMIKALCAIFESTLSSYSGIPNKHLLEVISALFMKLGEVSFIFMKNIVLKLASLMNRLSQGKSDTNHLQNCIGSSVVAMGPERILTLVPISVDADNFTCSNIWVVTVLKKHVIGASLGYYMEHIVPLAKLLAETSQKVEKSVTGQDLQAYAHDLWGLLPAFCHYPVDTHKKFKHLAKHLITFLKEDSLMHLNVAVAIQALVNQNRSALNSEDESAGSHSNADDALAEFKTVPSYSKKNATRNINALASCSTELLQALVDLYVDSQSEKLFYIKDAIGCLASITDSSVSKKILLSLLERFKIVNNSGAFEQLSHGDELSDTEQGLLSARCVIIELASSLIEGADEDLINLIYNYIVHVLKETDVTGHCEAYHALSRILKEHSWFCSSRFVELIDLLLNLKPPADLASLKNRFACYGVLIVHTLEKSLEEENTKGFLMLNEIILTLKDAKDEVRKVAYDAILTISSAFRNSLCAGSSEPYHQLITMIMGYLSGPSPHIKSAAISAMSLLVYNDADICIKMPDLVPSILSLLQNKAVEVIKAVLGFVKVLVSTLPAKDLKNLLPDIVNGVLLWSTVSRFHFRSKVTVILEILVRKCGSTAVELNTPAKHKGFVETVLQNRHHKSTSQEAGKTDMESTPADSSNKRMNKRKHEESGSVSAENGSFHHRKRGRKHEENQTKPRASSSIGGGPEGAVENGSFHHRKRGRKHEENQTKPRASSSIGSGPEGAKTGRNSKYVKPKRGQSAEDNKKSKFITKNKGGGTKFQRQPASVSQSHKHNKTEKKQKSRK